MSNDQDIERIRDIIETTGQRYGAKGGSVQFAGMENATVKIMPSGFCWR